jgi:hypothetical protein
MSNASIIDNERKKQAGSYSASLRIEFTASTIFMLASQSGRPRMSLVQASIMSLISSSSGKFRRNVKFRLFRISELKGHHVISVSTLLVVRHLPNISFSFKVVSVAPGMRKISIVAR